MNDFAITNSLNNLDSYSKLNNKEDSVTNSKKTPNELSKEEQAQLQEMKKRDREVKAHERAHLSAGGSYVRGGASFSYQRGPDGQLYATGGEVSIDTSKERTPEETLRKARIIKQAALAPAKPSVADRAVAAKATRMELEAEREIAKKATEKQETQYYNSLGLVKNTFSPENPPLSVNFLV